MDDYWLDTNLVIIYSNDFFLFFLFVYGCKQEWSNNREKSEVQSYYLLRNVGYSVQALDSEM